MLKILEPKSKKNLNYFLSENMAETIQKFGEDSNVGMNSKNSVGLLFRQMLPTKRFLCPFPNLNLFCNVSYQLFILYSD